MLGSALLSKGWSASATSCGNGLSQRTPYPRACDGSKQDVYEADDLLLDSAYERASRQQSFEKLAPSTALPPLPDGRRLTIGLGSLADCDTGGRVWAGASVLCGWLEANAAQVRGRSVCELGCGTGAVGLYAAALGADRIVLTDGGSEALLALATSNAGVNTPLWADHGTNILVERHEWGTSLADDALFTGHDWILASDVTYATHAHEALCTSLAVLLLKSPGASAVIAHQHRIEGTAKDERLQSFVAAAEAAELSVDVMSSRSVDQGDRRVSLLRVQGDSHVTATSL